jgi:hypothetical protein
MISSFMDDVHFILCTTAIIIEKVFARKLAGVNAKPGASLKSVLGGHGEVIRWPTFVGRVFLGFWDLRAER